MHTFRWSMHKKPKILTVGGGWGFSASRSLLFGGSSQPFTTDTNQILTKVLLLKRAGEVKVGFLLTYSAVLRPSVQFFSLEVLQREAGRWDITLLLKQWTIWFFENSQCSWFYPYWNQSGSSFWGCLLWLSRLCPGFSLTVLLLEVALPNFGGLFTRGIVNDFVASAYRDPQWGDSRSPVSFSLYTCFDLKTQEKTAFGLCRKQKKLPIMSQKHCSGCKIKLQIKWK